MSRKNTARKGRIMEKNNGMIKLCGLWKKESKDGATYYSGKLSYSTNILLFPNKYKQGEKDPDLILYIGKAEKKEKEKKSAPITEDVPF
jgi:hypothetical protein